MASKRRLRRKACDGKTKHISSRDAMDAIHSLKRSGKYNTRMNVYKCKFCKKYHIGHTSWNG